MPFTPDPQPIASPSQRSLNVIAIGVVLALLYFGKDVLVPIILAMILALLMAPFVRLLQKMRLGHAYAVLIAVLLLAMVATGLMTVIGSQIVHLAESLPQYERTVHAKLQMLHDLTTARLETMGGEAGKVINAFGASSSTGQTQEAPVAPSYTHAMDVPVFASPWNAIRSVLSSLWSPLETAGIVLVVLVFVLLEYESLRDRFIRAVGGTDLRATTAAINDAGERLSRFR
jgi:predicted PurR-regulated permease PerM